MKIPFNRPSIGDQEIANIRVAIENLHLASNGAFTRRCQSWLSRSIGSPMALLTHSCTSALEFIGLLLDLQPGDEVIMPSFTFVSTANAVVLRGATPVFVDVRDDNLCLDETKIEAAISDRTRAVVVVHYAGVACDMEAIESICSARQIALVEDSAQGIGASYRGRPLGSFGAYAALSFHETKNVVSGEGGAIMINDRDAIERAQILWEKGTNRAQFARGEVNKYRWMDLGSSFAPSEITAAFLSAQLDRTEDINDRRRRVWSHYYRELAELEASQPIRRPIVPDFAEHNGHLFYLLLETAERRDEVLGYLNERGVNAVFHYVPLHSAPAGERFGRVSGSMDNTDRAGNCLIRLPLWPDMSESETAYVVETLASAFGRKSSGA